MPAQLAESVVVVTGASSGIGRATALAFAREGAAVVVAARRAEPLERLVEECRALGASALAVPTDVTEERAVRDLARRPLETFGGLDVWINNAAVGALGDFEAMPPDVFRRVIDVDFFGYVHGARAAIAQFRAQGRGVIVNVASVLGKVAMPYYTPYVAAKFAVVGFSESLREELLGTGIDVVTIMPAAMDTPFFQHSANYTGRALKPPRPVYDPERVAEAIVAAASRPCRERFVGGAARAFHLLHVLAPGLYERAARLVTDYDHFQNVPAAPTSGAALTPMTEGTEVRGGWRPPRSQRRRRAALGVALVVPALLAWRATRRAA
jgi:NAD(P)-dependent dehydrogenase (short-subunit alcohol dehydrogenase family)